MKKKIDNEEIDFSQAILFLWYEKFKILIITLICVFISLAVYFNKKQVFIATTEIKPINVFNENKYKNYNNLINNYKNITELENLENLDSLSLSSREIFFDEINIKYPMNIFFDEIDRKYLMNIFLEKIQEKEILINAIKEFKLLDENKYNDQELYKEALEKIALSIKFSPTERNNNTDRNNNIDGDDEYIDNWKIVFETSEPEKWINILNHLNIKINEQIRQILVSNFKTNKKITTQNNQFMIEDLNKEIGNLKIKFDMDIKKRLAFLKEQSVIARELDISKSTLEIKNYFQTTVISSESKNREDSHDDYYLKGYKMIEKEIEILKNRKNRDYFIEDLDRLVEQKRKIIDNKIIERVELIFLNTPAAKNKNFIAANIIDKNTKFQRITYSIKNVLLIAVAIGLILSALSIFSLNILKNNKRKNYI